jgi:glutathione S-transferase
MAEDRVLYGNTPVTSPYVMSVFVGLEEKGLPFELRLLDLERGDQFEEDFVRHSITNRVPTLRDGEFWVSESTAILEYLEDRYPAPKYARLYPEDLRERARVRMVQGLLRSDFMPLREERPTESFLKGAMVHPLTARAVQARDRLLRIAGRLVGEGRSSIATNFSIADADLAMMLMRLLANGEAMPESLTSYTRAVFRRPSVAKFLALTDYREH